MNNIFDHSILDSRIDQSPVYTRAATVASRQTINPNFAARRMDRRAAPARDFTVLDLFSGIGGFSLGLDRAGMTTVAFCEIDPFCRRILAQHWPDVPLYPDIHQLSARRLHHDRIPPIDLICGGYPCQPFSIAGKRRGEHDPRHLWPQMHRLVRELRPRWVVCENVAGHVELGLDTVLDDLEADGYTATAFIVPACAVGAPHWRDRVWVVAHAAGLGLPGSMGTQGRQSVAELPSQAVWRNLPAPFTCGDDDGIPFRLERTQALGNAVVPQIPEVIGRAILWHHQLLNRQQPEVEARNTSMPPKPPTHHAYQVRDRGEGEKAIWTRIGSAWPHTDGQSFNIQIEVMPLDGRISLRTASERKN